MDDSYELRSVTQFPLPNSIFTSNIPPPPPAPLFFNNVLRNSEPIPLREASQVHEPMNSNPPHTCVSSGSILFSGRGATEFIPPSRMPPKTRRKSNALRKNFKGTNRDPCLRCKRLHMKVCTYIAFPRLSSIFTDMISQVCYRGSVHQEPVHEMSQKRLELMSVVVKPQNPDICLFDLATGPE